MRGAVSGEKRLRTPKKQRGARLRLGLALLGGAAIGAVSEAAAQTAPSQARPGPSAETPETRAPFTFPQSPAYAAPAGAEDVRFILNALVVDGGFEDMADEADALAAPLIGREISVADLYAVAAQLQTAYFDAGYPLVRVVVPQQEVGPEGAPRLLVVDGVVAALDVEQLPENVRAPVTRILGALVGQARPTASLIERKLLLAGDTAGLALRSALRPGARTGETVLVLTGEHQSTEFVLSFDNRVTEDLGREQVTASVALNSPSGLGERFFATYAARPEPDAFESDAQRRFMIFGVSLPVGTDGGSVGALVEYSSTRPRGPSAPLQLDGEYARASLSASYPILRSRVSNAVVRGAFDIISDKQATRFGGPPVTLSMDRTRVVRLGLDSVSAILNGRGRLGLSAELSHGLGAMGARTKDEATPFKPLSRSGADANFTHLSADVDLTAALPLGIMGELAASGQYSFEEPQLRSEQFSPSSWRGLSGPPPGMMVGDTGGVARAELARPIALTPEANAAVAPYIFAAYAETHLYQPSFFENARTEATVVGAGARLSLPALAGWRVSGALEWSSVQSNDPALDRTWTTFTVSLRY